MRATEAILTRETLFRTQCRCAAFVIVAAAAPFALACAQAPKMRDTSTALRLGDTVQVRMVNLTSPRATGTTCVGTVGAMRPDTIYVTRSDACGPRYIERTDLRSLRVARGTAGSRLQHTATGMLIGSALVGGASAIIAAGQQCSGCDEFPPVFAADVGGAVGMSAGGLLGGALPAGPRWLNVSDPPAIRIAGYTLRPGLQIVTGPTARSENRGR